MESTTICIPPTEYQIQQQTRTGNTIELSMTASSILTLLRIIHEIHPTQISIHIAQVTPRGSPYTPHLPRYGHLSAPNTPARSDHRLPLPGAFSSQHIIASNLLIIFLRAGAQRYYQPHYCRTTRAAGRSSLLRTSDRAAFLRSCPELHQLHPGAPARTRALFTPHARTGTRGFRVMMRRGQLAVDAAISNVAGLYMLHCSRAMRPARNALLYAPVGSWSVSGRRNSRMQLSRLGSAAPSLPASSLEECPSLLATAARLCVCVCVCLRVSWCV